MKPIKISLMTVALVLFTFALVGWNTNEKDSDTTAKENVIILLKFKAQAEKGDQTIAALEKLFAEVKKEPNYVSIKLHVDPNDNTNILLYEEWEDLGYYNGEHMTTEHLQAFMAASSNFLAGPPDISVWEVKGVFK